MEKGNCKNKQVDLGYTSCVSASPLLLPLPLPSFEVRSRMT